MAGKPYKLDDLVAYCQCPLKARYRSLGITKEIVDDREAMIKATEVAIGAFMREAAKDIASKELASRMAVHAYKAVLAQYDKLGVLSNSTRFTELFNYGLVLVRAFADSIDEKHDRVVHGPHPNFSCPVDKDFVVGDILGLVSFSDRERGDRTYGVVHVAARPVVRPVWDRIREGFCYKATRQALSGLDKYPLLMVNVDPFRREVLRYGLSIDDQVTFDALAGAAIRGIENNVFVPQPSREACGRCSFESVCDLRYAKPELTEVVIRTIMEKASG